MRVPEYRVHVECRLRPTRFGFLCASESMREVRAAIEANTVLWGGSFNPIIPNFSRRPEWVPTGTRGVDATLGYIEGLQPDYLVVSSSAHAERLGWQRRTVTPETLLVRSDRDREVSGTDVIELYRHLYETRYGFQQRQHSDAVLPIAPSARLEPLIAATFGCYSPALKQYEAAYRKVFAPREVIVAPENLFSTLVSLSPLNAGSLGLRVRSGSPGGLPGVVLYLADPGSPSDVIDYWNLRTLHSDVLPVPLPWLSDMSASLEWLLSRIRSSPDEKARSHITVIAGRSIPEQRRDELVSRVSDIAANSADIHVSYYPRIWNRWGREADHFRIAEVTAEHEDQEISALRRNVTLACLMPTFAKHSSRFGTARWVNVFQFRNYGSDPHFPEVFVPDLQDVARLFGLLGLGEIWPNIEGVAISADGVLTRQQIRMPTGEETLAALFKRSGYSSSISDAGVVAHQLAIRLGHRQAISMLADINLIRLLDKMSRGHRATRSQMLEHLKVEREVFKDASKRRLERLVGAGVLRVGLEVRCDVCRSRNWVDLRAIDHTISCDRCLESFPFPSAQPPTNWQYRIAGPLGAPGYARGAYSVLLTVRFFDNLTGFGAATWAPPMNLSKGSERLEVDFAVLMGRSRFDHAWPGLFLGEAKTEGDFKPADVSRLKKLARAFPHAAIVAATLKNELSTSEKRRLLPLAKAGWDLRKSRRPKVPLIVLTGKQLLWTEAGSWLHAQERRGAVHGPDWMWDLAALTQLDNLDYDPYAAVHNDMMALGN